MDVYASWNAFSTQSKCSLLCFLSYLALCSCALLHLSLCPPCAIISGAMYTCFSGYCTTPIAALMEFRTGCLLPSCYAAGLLWSSPSLLWLFSTKAMTMPSVCASCMTSLSLKDDCLGCLGVEHLKQALTVDAWSICSCMSLAKRTFEAG